VPDLWDMSIDHPDLPAAVVPGQPDKPVADPAAVPAYLELPPRKLPWRRPVLPQKNGAETSAGSLSYLFSLGTPPAPAVFSTLYADAI
jgi:hypothetical protein